MAVYFENKHKLEYEWEFEPKMLCTQWLPICTVCQENNCLPHRPNIT